MGMGAAFRGRNTRVELGADFLGAFNIPVRRTIGMGADFLGAFSIPVRRFVLLGPRFLGFFNILDGRKKGFISHLWQHNQSKS